MSAVAISVFCLIALVLVCLFVAWFFVHKARHQERMLMIEKGMNPNDATNDPGIKTTVFKIGLVIMGLSIGLGIVGMLSTLLVWDHAGVIPVSIIGICGGGAVLIASKVGAPKK